jgi:hypothetical protein
MKNIKIIGALLFVVSVTLAVLFNYTSKENITHNNLLNTINEQKDFAQEISKNIFYIYKNKESSTEELDNSIKKFLDHMNNKDQTLIQSNKVMTLWNEFYLHVEHFRNQSKTVALYSNIILEEIVKNIYNTNLKLVVEFDRLIKEDKTNFDNRLNLYKNMQYTLLFIFVLLLLYLFTQLKSIVSFIQKFLFTSKNIIANSSIKDLEPIDISQSSIDMSEITDNFNTLVQKVNNSIENSSNSMEHSYKSLEIVEQHIEELIDLICAMNEKNRDKALTQKEDAIIQSLEELSSCTRGLKNLKNDLNNLISHSKSN